MDIAIIIHWRPLWNIFCTKNNKIGTAINNKSDWIFPFIIMLLTFDSICSLLAEKIPSVIYLRNELMTESIKLQKCLLLQTQFSVVSNDLIRKLCNSFFNVTIWKKERKKERKKVRKKKERNGMLRHAY